MKKQEILYLADRAGLGKNIDQEALMVFATFVALMERKECREAAFACMGSSDSWDVKNGVMLAVNAITARGGDDE
jgi:hypothetical protein